MSTPLAESLICLMRLCEVACAKVALVAISENKSPIAIPRFIWMFRLAQLHLQS